MRARVCARQRLAATGRPDQQNVAFLQLDTVGGRQINPLVMVVHRDREHLLGALLADHILAENAVNVLRLRDFADCRSLFLRHLRRVALDDLVAKRDAIQANPSMHAENELLDLLARLTAQQAAAVVSFGGESSHGSRKPVLNQMIFQATVLLLSKPAL